MLEVVGIRDVVQEGDAKDETAGSMEDADDECVAAAVWSSAETLVGAMDALRRLVMIQAGRSSVNRYSLSSQQEPDCAAFWPVGRRLTSAVQDRGGKLTAELVVVRAVQHAFIQVWRIFAAGFSQKGAFL